jgi:hypothetical protein
MFLKDAFFYFFFFLIYLSKKKPTKLNIFEVFLRKYILQNLYVIIPIHQDRNPKNIDISIDWF